MWNRKKEEEPNPRQATPYQQPSADAVKESMPMSTPPARSFEPEPPRSSATIGKSVVIKGQIISREDLVVDGELEGNIEAQEHRVTVGPNGRIQASIKAREIVVIGQVHGNVEAGEKIDIRKEARLIGDIKTARVVIEDGAFFKGSIDIQKSETSARPQEKPRPQQQQPAQPQSPAMAAPAEVKR